MTGWEIRDNPVEGLWILSKSICDLVAVLEFSEDYIINKFTIVICFCGHASSWPWTCVPGLSCVQEDVCKILGNRGWLEMGLCVTLIPDKGKLPRK